MNPHFIRGRVEELKLIERIEAKGIRSMPPKNTQRPNQELKLPDSPAPPSPDTIESDSDDSSITLIGEDDPLLSLSEMIEPQDNASRCRCCSFCIAWANIGNKSYENREVPTQF